MKKLLILTASTGEGHNQAARALKSTFESNNWEVSTMDFLQANSKILSKIFIGGYKTSATSTPKFYGILYKIFDTKPANDFLGLLFSFVRRKISKYISEYNPDVIITTHPLAVNILGSLKKKGLKQPVISVVTDFRGHGAYINKNVDMFITGSEYTKGTLIERGIESNRIYPYGIPILDAFKESIPDILTTRDDDFVNILLMSGSMGLTQISDVVKELLANINKLRITVVCGNNKELKDEITKKYTNINKNKKLHIIGFTKDVSSLMDYSDIIITKPGGLTVTEAVTKKLPLIIPFAIPGQEIENRDFLVNSGYALKIDNLLELNPLIDKIIENPDMLKHIRENLDKLSSTYSNNEIYKTIEKLLK